MFQYVCPRLKKVRDFESGGRMSKPILAIIEDLSMLIQITNKIDLTMEL